MSVHKTTDRLKATQPGESSEMIDIEKEPGTCRGPQQRRPTEVEPLCLPGLLVARTGWILMLPASPSVRYVIERSIGGPEVSPS